MIKILKELKLKRKSGGLARPMVGRVTVFVVGQPTPICFWLAKGETGQNGLDWLVLP